MEYEIDELTDAFWTIQDPVDRDANHMPGWFGDSAGNNQTGEWIPEEGGALASRSLEPVG
jgi:hypothetical protein